MSVDPWALTRPVTDIVDGAMARALVLGYTRIGSGLRRRWWPADPAPVGAFIAPKAAKPAKRKPAVKAKGKR